jgi:hypothetical protein
MADRLLRQEWKNKNFCPLYIRNLETVLVGVIYPRYHGPPVTAQNS